MKKVVLGTGLIICGVIGLLALLIIYFMLVTSQTNFAQTQNDFSSYRLIFLFGAILIAGIVLNMLGFCEDKKT